jgi:hypothetical protein
MFFCYKNNSILAFFGSVRAGSLIRCEKQKRSATAFQKKQRHFFLKFGKLILMPNFSGFFDPFSLLPVTLINYYSGTFSSIFERASK